MVNNRRDMRGAKVEARRTIAPLQVRSRLLDGISDVDDVVGFARVTFVDLLVQIKHDSDGVRTGTGIDAGVANRYALLLTRIQVVDDACTELLTGIEGCCDCETARRHAATIAYCDG